MTFHIVGSHYVVGQTLRLPLLIVVFLSVPNLFGRSAWDLPSGGLHETLRAVPTNFWFWIAFHLGVFMAITVDLVSFKRRGRALSIRAAAFRTAVWIVLSLLFNLVVWKLRGPDKGLEFLTGYVIEYSLSIDNIFVFVLIFAYFRVPPIAQHRVLVWGILGALAMRGIVIWLGVALVERFDFILYFFGAFLLVSAWRMFFAKKDEHDFGNTLVMRFCRRLVRVTGDFYDEDFTAKIDNRWMLTPLALVLIVIDVMDLVFAVDSIPAVFAITRDAFIVYTSNICAILGLRSLYFLVAKLMDRFVYLKNGLAFVLGFVGLKMILGDYFRVPTPISLGIIVGILATTIVVSMSATQRQREARGAK
jgi:TerC family integral membrane protein